MDSRGCEVRLSGTTLWLRPERVLYWPEEGLLAAADLHWGKTESFRQHGIPLPSGVLEDDLARLSQALRNTGARKLLLVGDLVHTREGLTDGVLQHVTRWRQGHDVEMVLVRGNHERHLQSLPPAWRMSIEEEHLDVGPFRFAHHPEPAPGRYVWAGHLHPTVRLSSGADRLRLPCFHVGRAVGVLPAFSAFTGGYNVTRRPGERVFAIAEDSVIEV